MDKPKEVTMLGENHSLINEFPNHKNVINQLNKNDKPFSEDANRYDLLDAEIRELELSDAPIGDDSMHLLKQERAMLKDSLFQRLLAVE